MHSGRFQLADIDLCSFAAQLCKEHKLITRHNLVMTHIHPNG
ncbi:MAG: hypothetical protein OFPI_11420 [Osedax symbiont Rs2]|nr:MAG: hypothetical protein OFPI_11420 [Osedax symbiont Rs2]